jgi:hypothetical protein
MLEAGRIVLQLRRGLATIHSREKDLIHPDLEIVVPQSTGLLFVARESRKEKIDRRRESFYRTQFIVLHLV